MNNKSTCTVCKAAEDLNSSPYFNTDQLCSAGYPENTFKHLFIQNKHKMRQILDTWRDTILCWKMANGDSEGYGFSTYLKAFDGV